MSRIEEIRAFLDSDTVKCWDEAGLEDHCRFLIRCIDDATEIVAIVDKLAQHPKPLRSDWVAWKMKQMKKVLRGEGYF